MNVRVLAVVEGQTESAVLSNTLAPHLGARAVSLCPKVVGKPGHKGGVYRSFNAVANEMLNLFKQEPKAVVTTFFDFYGLPEDWPGVADAKARKKSGLPTSEVAKIVEASWLARIEILTSTLAHPARFIPYIQMHELEALLFANPQVMADVFRLPQLNEKFAKIVSECGGCEEINDRPTHAPSKRIAAHFPGYRKGRDRNKREDRLPHAPVVTARIGVEGIREACPHFDEWVTALEALGYPLPE